MRYSNFFGKTEKTTASDAQLKSHKLLVKGGFVRRVSTGRWALLPLGFRVWEKIYKIIDEEMKSINCQKLVVPTLHPIEIWKKTNRDEAFGEEMLVVKDHHGAEFALGATAEGVML
ncbi:MAG: proline--tRNA ligase, partial [Patescibacteria group bacterium]